MKAITALLVFIVLFLFYTVGKHEIDINRIKDAITIEGGEHYRRMVVYDDGIKMYLKVDDEWLLTHHFTDVNDDTLTVKTLYAN